MRLPPKHEEKIDPKISALEGQLQAKEKELVDVKAELALSEKRYATLSNIIARAIFEPFAAIGVSAVAVLIATFAAPTLLGLASVFLTWNAIAVISLATIAAFAVGLSMYGFFGLLSVIFGSIIWPFLKFLLESVPGRISLLALAYAACKDMVLFSCGGRASPPPRSQRAPSAGEGGKSERNDDGKPPAGGAADRPAPPPPELAPSPPGPPAPAPLSKPLACLKSVFLAPLYIYLFFLNLNPPPKGAGILLAWVPTLFLQRYARVGLFLAIFIALFCAQLHEHEQLGRIVKGGASAALKGMMPDFSGWLWPAEASAANV